MGDVFEMLQDFLLGVTQWHILTYMKVLNQFMDNQEAYLKIYRVVGELDAAVSTGSFRKSLPLVTVPEYEEAKQLFLWDEDGQEQPVRIKWRLAEYVYQVKEKIVNKKD